MLEVLADLASGLVLAIQRLAKVLRLGVGLIVFLALLATNIATLVSIPFQTALSTVIDRIAPGRSVQGQINQKISMAEADAISARQRAREFEARLGALDRQKVQLTAERADLIASRDGLRAEVDVGANRLATVDAELAQTRAERQALANSLELSRNQITEAQGVIAALRTQSNSLLRDLDAQTRQVVALDAERLNLRSDMQASTAQLGEARATSLSLQLQVRQSEADLFLSELDNTQLEMAEAARIARIDGTTTRILRRNVVTAQRSIGAVSAEWAPGIGNAINLLGLAWDMADICQTSTDMVTLRRDLGLVDPSSSDRDQVCGMQVPTVAELLGTDQPSPAEIMRQCISMAQSGNIDPAIACPLLLPDPATIDSVSTQTLPPLPEPAPASAISGLDDAPTGLPQPSE